MHNAEIILVYVSFQNIKTELFCMRDGTEFEAQSFEEVVDLLVLNGDLKW